MVEESFFHLIDIAVVNSFTLFREHQAQFPDEPGLRRTAENSLTHFREEIVQQLCDFPEYDYQQVHATAKPACPPPDHGPFVTENIPIVEEERKMCVVCWKREKVAYKVRIYVSASRCMIDEHYLSMVIVGGSVFELTNGDLRAAGVLPKPSCRQNMLYNLFMLSFSSMIKIYIKLFCSAVCDSCDQLHTGSTTCSIHICVQEQINNKTPLLKNTSIPARMKTTKAFRSRSLSAKTTPLIYASMKHFTLESMSFFACKA